MTSDKVVPSKKALLALLNRLKTKSSISRSKNYSRLLEYLINREIDIVDGKESSNQSPKEIEVAINVFGKTTDFNSSDDSTVRVHISNLRKKLKEYFEEAGDTESFHILIPSGEYRLLFVKNNSSTTSTSALSVIDEDAHTQLKKSKKWLVLTDVKLIAGLLVISVLVHFGFLFYKQSPVDNMAIEKVKVEKHEVWSDLEGKEDQVLIVLGGQGSAITRGIAQAYKNILLSLDYPHKSDVRLIQELSVTDLREYHIIYIGDFKSLGPLQNYFKGSTFSLKDEGISFPNEDQHTTYSAPAELNKQYVDYGLFAKFDGPNKHKIYIIAGYTNAALRRFGYFLTEDWGIGAQRFVERMKKYKITSYNNFEVLYETPSLDGIHLSQEIIYAGKVNSKVIWK